jgi:hypothetical protein
MQAAEGTKMVVSFMNDMSLSLNNTEFEITNIAIPDANLSKRLYIPNTKAPCLPLDPIT